MHNMAKKKSPTPTQPGSETTPGKIAEQHADHKPGNGGNVRTLKNGAIYSMDTKRIIAAPPRDRQVITSENAHEYHELSRKARLEAVYRGLATGTGRSNAHAAVEAIVARQAELAMAIDRGR